MPSSDKNYFDYMSKCKSPASSFYFTPILPEEIHLEILFIPSNKSYGLYSSSTKLIKCSRNIMLFSCGIFIDLTKAFDTVDHDILPQKLQYYGFRRLVNNWFSSYLKNRTQTTQIGHYISSKVKISCGIPQGSVLGPLLFLLYVNDIYIIAQTLKFYLFADDTTILYAEKNIKVLEKAVNIELQKLYDWLTANKLYS